MAGSGYTRGTSSNGRRGQTRTKNRSQDVYTYVDGTAVRQLDVAPYPAGRELPAEQEFPAEQEPKREVSAATQRNRERTLQMNLPYVLFLTAAAVITVFVCVNFLQLRAKNTILQEDVASLEADLDSAILENDSEYNRVMNSVDLEYVKEVAVNELGMQLATTSQIVTYTVEDSDYVRQYSEIPEE